jgi:hypothetical protein
MTTPQYRPPGDLEFNSYVGELRSPSGSDFAELKVRYGVDNDRYLDWSITLNHRVGGVSELRESSGPLERRAMEVIDVSDSAIRRQIFNPDDLDQLPRVLRLVELGAEDQDRVDAEYQNQLDRLCARWAKKHGYEVANFPSNRHNTATLNFMAKDRDADFREGESFGWVRNTVVCIDTDFADMVIADRAYHYFPTSSSTAAVLMPNDTLMFIWIAKGRPPDDTDTAAAESNDGPIQAHGDTTMGMLVDSIYAGDWVDQVDGLDG